MKIKEVNSWNKFYIPIPSKEEESHKQYLERIRGCLKTFYKKYTSQQVLDCYYDLFKTAELESLVGEWNFAEFHLKGISYCDVKFAVGTPEDNYGNIGIDVWSHRDDEGYRKPMLDFLKQKWKEFEYNF